MTYLPRESRPIANEPSTLAEAAERGEQPAALDWGEALAYLGGADGFWFVTVDRQGHPHPRPVLAVVVDGALHTTSSLRAQKAKNLLSGGRCAFAVHTDDFDFVIEGRGHRVTDRDALERVADHYRPGWPVTVEDDAFDAPFGAPTAGPPPYAVFRIDPDIAYGFGITDQTNFRSTRWRF